MPNDFGQGVAQGLANSFRYLPQHSIEGLLGPKYGPMVERFIGMSPAPDPNGEVLQAPAMPDPNYHSQQLENANKSFLAQPQPAPAKPDLSTMRKPLKGK